MPGDGVGYRSTFRAGPARLMCGEIRERHFFFKTPLNFDDPCYFLQKLPSHEAATPLNSILGQYLRENPSKEKDRFEEQDEETTDTAFSDNSFRQSTVEIEECCIITDHRMRIGASFHSGIIVSIAFCMLLPQEKLEACSRVCNSAVITLQCMGSGSIHQA